jgi:hypothetical protein
MTDQILAKRWAMTAISLLPNNLTKEQDIMYPPVNPALG